MRSDVLNRARFGKLSPKRGRETASRLGLRHCVDLVKHIFFGCLAFKHDGAVQVLAALRAEIKRVFAARAEHSEARASADIGSAVRSGIRAEDLARRAADDEERTGLRLCDPYDLAGGFVSLSFVF